ncbi:MAG: Gp138 family membrane-puncturing spike protein [Allorhizobium sp.]
MVGLLGKVTNDPVDTIGQMTQTERESQWGAIPGEIVTYDAAKGTATVRPLYKPVVAGKKLDMPDLYEVPVDQPRTAGMGITFPIPAGTKVMLSPQMRAFEDYEEGNEATPTDARSFHISNMRASLSGGDSLSDPLPGADAENFHLRFNASGSFGLKGSPDGKFQLNGAEGDVIDLLAEVCETLGVLTTTVSSGSSTGIWPITQQAALAALAARLRAMVL